MGNCLAAPKVRDVDGPANSLVERLQLGAAHVCPAPAADVLVKRDASVTRKPSNLRSDTAEELGTTSLTTRSVTVSSAASHNPHFRITEAGLSHWQAAQSRCGSRADEQRAEALARSMSLPVAHTLGGGVGAGQHAETACGRPLPMDTLDAHGRLHPRALAAGPHHVPTQAPGSCQQHHAAGQAESPYSRSSGDPGRSSYKVSEPMRRMLELISQLLCPDLVVLKVMGPPDRSFVRDAAGIRPGALPAFLPFVAEVVLHASSGRVIGGLAIASRQRGAQRPADRKLLLSLGGKVAAMLEAEEAADCLEGDFRHTSGSSCASGGSDALRESSIEARHIINRTSGILEEALACERLSVGVAHDMRTPVLPLPAPKEAVMLVGVGPGEWRALCCDRAITRLTGVRQSALLKDPLWEVLRAPCDRDSAPWRAICEVAAHRGEFFVHGVRVWGRPSGGAFALRFRPAQDATPEDWQQLASRASLSTFAIAGLAARPARLFFVSVSADEIVTNPAQQAAALLQLHNSTGSAARPSPLGSEAPSAAGEAALACIAFRRDAAAGAVGTGGSIQGKRKNVPPVPIQGLELGQHIGAGSNCSNVFVGRWRDQTVAVKVCDSGISASEGPSLKPWSGVEAVQWRTLEHPHLVRTLAHTMVLVPPPPPPPEHSARVSLDSAKSVAATPIPARSRRRAGLLDDAVHRASFHSTRELDAGADHSRAFASAQPRRSSFDSGALALVLSKYGPEDEVVSMEQAEVETWTVLEYCNGGDLKTGLEKGLFTGSAAAWTSQRAPNLAAVLTAAAQIASALAHLHNQGIMHGNLSLSKVLLADPPAGSRSSINCKVTDLGLSRLTPDQKPVATKTCGSIAHAPPEMIREGRLSPAADVYAFGVLLTELLSGEPAWAHLKSHAQVIAAVLGGKRPSMPPSTPPKLEELVVWCMVEDAEQRPAFSQILSALEELRHELLPEEEAA